MKKKIIVGVFVPIIFILLNYVILKVPVNVIEIIMVILITVITMWSYGKTDDYLNPMVYFPILYFALYWLGDFDLGIGYAQVPTSMWLYYLLGILGFYYGVSIINILKIKPKVYDKEDMLSNDARFIFFIIYAVCMGCKILAYQRFGIPLLVSNVDATRQVFAEESGILKVISSAHTILAVYFFYDLISRKVNNKPFKIGNLLIIICSFFVSLLDVSRLLLIQMFLPMFFIFLLKVRKIKLKNIIKIILLLLVFISVNKFARNIMENPDYINYIMKNRSSSMFVNVTLSGFNSFRVAIEDLRRVIEIVPSESSYTYGKMFFNSVLSVLPGKQVVIGYYVADLLNLKFDGMGAATTILGMFYLDGGPVLIFIGMFLFGIFVQANYKKHIKNCNISIYSLIGVYIIYYSVLALRTNVMPTIEPLLVMFYYCVFSYIAKCAKFGVRK